MCGPRPNIGVYFDLVGVVKAATRDRPKVRPAIKGEANGCPATRAEVNVDFLATLVRGVLVLLYRTSVELYGVDRED